MAGIHRIALIMLVSAAVLSAAGCGFVYQRPAAEPVTADTPAAAPTPKISLLPFGNPTGATADPANADNYLIVRESAVISYNNSRGTANWVAWRTRARDLGESIPRSMFEPDPALPKGFRRIGYYDYSGSGYDRGHLLPSADRFGNREQNAETFYLTNIVPQAGDLNQFPWNELESYARSLVRRGSELYTIAGVYGEQERIKGKLTAPTNCWKVIVVFPRGQSVDSMTNITRVIAVDMPNVEGIADDSWQKYRTTVRAIEQKAGVDLFSTLPRDLQDRIETHFDGN